MKLSKIYLTASFALVSSVAQSAITYIDAVPGAPGNTYETTETQGDPIATWTERTVFGNGGLVFQAAGAAPELTTVIPSLSDGTYDVWVFFWDATNGNDQWTIDAGLTSGALTSYTNDNLNPIYSNAATVDAKTLTFSSTVLDDEGNRDFYGVNLGQATVTGGSSIEVYIDSSATNNDSRVWYDGVGFEAVSVAAIPEPSSTALLGLGGMALLLRRRR